MDGIDGLPSHAKSAKEPLVRIHLPPSGELRELPYRRSFGPAKGPGLYALHQFFGKLALFGTLTRARGNWARYSRVRPEAWPKFPSKRGCGDPVSGRVKMKRKLAYFS